MKKLWLINFILVSFLAINACERDDDNSKIAELETEIANL